MNFPKYHCIPTTLLTSKTYGVFIKRLLSEGAINAITFNSLTSVLNWNYIGLDSNHCIQTYTNPHSFMKVNEWLNYLNIDDKNYPNILTQEWLENWLEEKA